ncbi:MAG: DUF6503 family protein [Flavobacteriales bacterium]
MNYYFLFIFFLFFGLSLCSQNLTGKQLLEKSIDYHDPHGHWSKFNDSLTIFMETPDKRKRITKIKINLPEEYFYSKVVRDSLTTVFMIKKDSCEIVFNGSKNFSKETAIKYKLSCDRAKMYQNYYTYLYGLPMKLKDPGTIINPKVEKKIVKGKAYLVLKVSYPEDIGNDVWYFYFNTKTFAMEMYQFYHLDAKSGQEKEGEYILLSNEELIFGIKMPKKRAWFTNKDDTFLGTDVLISH